MSQLPGCQFLGTSSFESLVSLSLSWRRSISSKAGSSMRSDGSPLYNLAVVTILAKGKDNARREIYAAESALKRMLKVKAERGSALYALAGLATLEGKPDEALAMLAEAIPLEPTARRWARTDVAWTALRENEHFKALVG